MDVHNFSKDGKTFHGPKHPPDIPLLLQDLLIAVLGPSSEARMVPLHSRAAGRVPQRGHGPVLPAAGAIATGVPGSYTVGDVANLYNINPLYKAHLDGKGQQIGILTLADFIPSDAFTYWNLIGLKVDPHRLTRVRVDGGGELSADAGASETSLDVEQAGGIAPAAKLVVYDAPNTDASFIDLFYRAASDNIVDSLSVSWGLSEVYYYPALNDGEDFTLELVALHQALLESAAQGISIFCASGDAGAYDANDAFNSPIFNVLSVDTPASDPAITAMGGTTVPFDATFVGAPPGTPDLVVPTEQAFAWDYLQDYLVKYIDPGFQDLLFPVGSGGGVSIFWRRPYYQDATAGMRKTEAGQKVIFDDGSGPKKLMDLPKNLQGRNVPDLSVNADPFSGYLIYSTLDGGLIDGFGGTSFGGPQMNGVSALISQMIGERIGLWNPMLYRLKKGPGSPLRDITKGTNWFYKGIPGYEPATGLGVPDVDKLAKAIAKEATN